MEFSVFHQYRRLARKGYCKELTCQYCEHPQTLVLGENDEPNLMCYFCNVLTIPGQAMYDTISAIVREHTE